MTTPTASKVQRFYCYDCEKYIDAAVAATDYHVTCDCGELAFNVCEGHPAIDSGHINSAIGSTVYCNGSCEGPA